MSRKKDWEDYRKGVNDISVPIGGWIDECAQNEIHKSKQQDYIKSADERIAKAASKDDKCAGSTKNLKTT